MTDAELTALTEAEESNGHEGCELDCDHKRAHELAKAYLALRSAVRALELLYVRDGIGKECAAGIEKLFRHIAQVEP